METGSLGDQLMWIGGEWTEALSGAKRNATSPSSGQPIGTVPDAGREDAQRAIAAAGEVSDRLLWSTATERSQFCHRIADALERRQDELAAALVLDQGKPIREARMEARSCSHFYRQAAEDILRLNGETFHSADPNKRILSFYQARGIYAVITPWNFPYNIPGEYLSANVAAGNPVVWVPAPSTTACSLVYAKAIEDADLPAGIVNVVTGAGPVVGDEIVGSPETVGVCFTGSTRTGNTIAQRAGTKPTLLELGGNGPVIVLDDADLADAAQGIVFSAYFNAGQACSATERVIATEGIAEALVEEVLRLTEQVRLGDPFDEDTTMGPLNNEATASKMDRHLQDAVSKGAQIRVGGGRAEGFQTNLYYRPTVLTEITPEMDVYSEESFGPVVPVSQARSMEEAVALGNENAYGLISSVYTRSLSSAFYVAERLRTGVVNVNETPDYWESHSPYGGRAGTGSGKGRLGGMNTLREVLDVRTMLIDLPREETGHV